MKHTLVIDDATQQGRLIMELITTIKPTDDAVEFMDEELIDVDKAFDEFDEALIPAEEVFDAFKKRLVSEVKRKHVEV